MDKTTYNYNFPAYAVDSDVDFTEQVAKIKEEIAEVEEAYNKGTLEQIAIECMDVIVACETLLRRLPDGYIDAAKQMVYAKIAFRGKWEEDAVEQATNTDIPQSDHSAFLWEKKVMPLLQSQLAIKQ